MCIPSATNMDDMEGDLIALSPGRPSHSTSEPKQVPSFVDEWLENIQKRRAENKLADLEKMSASNAASHNDSADEDDDPDEHDRLLNPTPTPRTTAQTSSHGQENSSSSEVWQAPLTDPFLSSPASRPTAFEDLFQTPLRSRGNVVIIQGLPLGVTLRDVFSRISTGKVQNASLVRVPQVTAGVCAAITFENTRSTQQFMHVSRAYNTIWSFQPTDEGTEPAEVEISYFPDINTFKLCNSLDDIPLELQRIGDDKGATRCLVIKGIAFEMVQEVWEALRLPRLLMSPHYCSNLDDVWISCFQSGPDGRINLANLHIWYNSTIMATSAKYSICHRAWARRVKYENDPCDGNPYDVFFRPYEDAGFAWHSFPSQSLLAVHKARRTGELFAKWRAISQAVREAHAPVVKHKESREMCAEEIQRAMAERRKAARQNGGIDPVTLMYFNANDYDSDDEGDRRLPLIDTREIQTEKNAKLRLIEKERLLTPTAYVDALVSLAAHARPSTVFSPGTPTTVPVVSLVWHTVDEQANVPANNVASPSPEAAKTEELRTTTYQPKYWDYTCDLEPMREALKNPQRTHWYEVSLDEYFACDEMQRKAMGTSFYIPPKSFNSLKKYDW